MNVLNVSSRDLKVLFFIRPPFMVLLCYVLFGNAYFNDGKIFIPATIAAILVMVITWRLHIYADHFFRRRFLNYRHTVKRITVSVLFHFLIALVIINTLLFWADAVNFLGYHYTRNSYLSGVLVVLFTNMAATGFHEGVYMFENWKKTLLEAEELKKLTLKNRLTGLRNQTSPHFFFNSINTLSGLIEIDTEKADHFLNEMCIIYRYLLRNDKETFLPLSQEMSFISSWMHIVETRYGNAVKFIIHWADTSQSTAISRLTLLSFLENILETHVIDRKNIFCITLTVKEGSIEIIHPLQKIKTRTQGKSHEQVAEVKTIHRLLGLPEIQEHENSGIKTIIIPLQQNTISNERV